MSEQRVIEAQARYIRWLEGEIERLANVNSDQADYTYSLMRRNDRHT